MPNNRVRLDYEGAMIGGTFDGVGLYEEEKREEINELLNEKFGPHQRTIISSVITDKDISRAIFETDNVDEILNTLRQTAEDNLNRLKDKPLAPIPERDGITILEDEEDNIRIISNGKEMRRMYDTSVKPFPAAKKDTKELLLEKFGRGLGALVFISITDEQIAEAFQKSKDLDLILDMLKHDAEKNMTVHNKAKKALLSTGFSATDADIILSKLGAETVLDVFNDCGGNPDEFLRIISLKLRDLPKDEMLAKAELDTSLHTIPQSKEMIETEDEEEVKKKKRRVRRGPSMR